MEDIYRNLSLLSLWESDCSGDTSVEETELWLDEASGRIYVEHGIVDSGGIGRWLAQRSRQSEEQVQSLMLRFVWVDVDAQHKAIRLSGAARDLLLDSLDLKLAYGYSRSLVSGATAFPPRVSDPGVDQRAYSFCYVPKLAALWSHSRRKGAGLGSVTQCVVFAQDEEKRALKKSLDMQWDISTCKNPMFPSLLISLVLGMQIDLSNNQIKEQLRRVEKRTGHHNFASRHAEEAATQDLGELSEQTSGSAAKLSSTVRKAQTLERLLDWMLKTMDEDGQRSRSQTQRPDVILRPRSDGADVLRCHVGVLQERRKDQLLDTEYVLKRVQVQTEALFSIIAQRDSLSHLKLSRFTHEVAYFSYRDASSMKTLAVVTMLFLPGSFISALFSTPCFEWAGVDHQSSRIGVKPSPQFGLYWAITIPLTALTFTLYFVWLRFQKRVSAISRTNEKDES
ncbi:hypothetical protein CDD83_9406 [Cordyceps sp. RAO-2017]|nr:hypothetical protein CDD83_9406 [Cordyceps sp. RAO-2017]